MNKKDKQIIKSLQKREWTVPPYSIQSWGNWLHRIAPYVGRIKPSFAHFLIKYVSKENDVILDPFCGIGTIPVEASLMNRKGIGNDINPYAYYIALAKAQPIKSKEELFDYLDNLKIDTKKIKLKDIPDWVREYYNQDTLKEILFLIKKLKKDQQYFILGCLIGISQGHRPGHLSKPCAWTLPYKPKKDDKGEYREVLPRLKAKINRTYSDGFEKKTKLRISKDDTRKLSLKTNSVDHVITSPPYYDTLDYVGSHRLRLAIAGYYSKDELVPLKRQLIQKFDTYLEEMQRCINEICRVLKKGGYCVFIVGDCFKGKNIVNTANDLKDIFENSGFECLSIIADEIPINKSVQKTTSQQKFDRIMLLKKK